jgi:hypothetical protein
MQPERILTVRLHNAGRRAAVTAVTRGAPKLFRVVNLQELFARMADKGIGQIVGETEADVKSGKVSITSPTGRALIGKKAGDIVEVNTPGGGKSYEIVKVVYI